MTVGNLGPFFASLLAFCLVGERMTNFELVAMFLSFGAIIIIAIAQSNHEQEIKADAKKPMFFADNLYLAHIVGCCMMVIFSMANGVLSVLTRMMQSLPVSSMMVYIAVISLCLFSPGLLIENWISGGPLRIISYTGE